jgi:hypothetical protein
MLVAGRAAGCGCGGRQDEPARLGHKKMIVAIRKIKGPKQRRQATAGPKPALVGLTVI